MKFLCSLLAACGLLAVGGAQLNLTTAISELPACAVSCLLQILPSSACGITNVTCICTTVSVQADLSACIQESCRSTELDKVSSTNADLCAGYPYESRRAQGLIPAWVPGIITIIIVALRCYSRYRIAGRLWWDDWNILAATVLIVGILVISVLNYKERFGDHIWYLNTSQFAHLAAQFLAEEVFYVLALTFTRLSILCFYLRVFQHRQLFRKFVIGMITLVSIIGVAIFLTTVLQCRPLTALWDLTKPRELSCIDLNAFVYSAAGIGIAQDIAIILLPVPELLLLQMNLKKRLNVMFMFCLGSFACVTSIIRLKYLIVFSYSKDFSWDITDPSYWSMIEICASVICACLPAVRALLSIWLPGLFRFALSSKDVSQSSEEANLGLDTTRQLSNRLSRSVGEAKQMEVNVDEAFDTKLEEGNWNDSESSAYSHSRNSSNKTALAILKPSVYSQRNPSDPENPVTGEIKLPSKAIKTSAYSHAHSSVPTTPLKPTPTHHKNLSWHSVNRDKDDGVWSDRSVLQVPTMSDPQNSSDSDEPDQEEKRPTLVSRFSIPAETTAGRVKIGEEEMAILDHTAVEAVRLRAQKVTVGRGTQVHDRRHTPPGGQEAWISGGENMI